LLFGLLKIVICGMEMNLTLQKAVMAVPAWQGWFQQPIGDFCNAAAVAYRT
jgi:hypothetical protein